MYVLLLIWITLNTTSQDLIRALKLTCLKIGGTRYISFDRKEINPINYSLPRFDKNASFYPFPISVIQLILLFSLITHSNVDILILIFNNVGWFWGFVHFTKSLNSIFHKNSFCMMKGVWLNPIDIVIYQ